MNAKEMPQAIKQPFDRLRDEVTALQIDWNIYSQLQLHSKERIELLGSMVGGFFVCVAFALRNDITMSIGRLLDPKETRSHSNLCFELLMEEIKTFDHEFYESLHGQYQEIIKKCGGLKEWRNKVVGHRDFRIALSQAGCSLPTVDPKEIEEILELIRSFMNTIEAYYQDSETLYEYISSTGDADDLVFYLQEAAEHQKCKENALRKKHGFLEKMEDL